MNFKLMSIENNNWRCTALAATFSGALLLLGTSIWSEELHDDRWTECRQADTCTIESDHLANLTDQPFLFYGKVVDDAHPQFRKYKKSLGSYSDVRNCLVREEQVAKTPNLLKIDWKRISHSRGTEVCVFLVASSLGHVERVVDWLNYHKFRHSGVYNYKGDAFLPNYKTEPIKQITAQWTVEQYRAVKPSLFERLTGFDLVNGYQLVLSFDQNDAIAHVGVVTPTNLN